MLKIISTLSVGAFMLLGVFFADGVVIEDDTPSALTPGESKLVTIQINKGQVSGFAKLQLELPKGMTATAVETQGASFTFQGQKAKFIWMVLPQDQEFSVSYNLAADENASGDKVITGAFSYIRDNARVDYALNSKTVSLGSAPMADNAGDKAEGEGAGATASTLGSEFGVMRNVTQLSETEYLVNVIVANAELDGFAKVMENFGEGYQAEPDNTSGATVTMETNGIKFVWFSPPTTEEFEVSYKLTQTDPNAAPPFFDGSFAYIKDNNPYELAINDGGFNEQIADNTGGIDGDFPTDPATSDNGSENMVLDNSADLAAQQAAAEAEEERLRKEAEEMAAKEADALDAQQAEEAAAEQAAAQQKAAEQAAQQAADEEAARLAAAEKKAEEASQAQQEADRLAAQQQEAAKQAEEAAAAKRNADALADNGITTIPEPETGVKYRVQIAAGPNTVGKPYFKSRHNFAEKFNIENHSGYVKYTTGRHGEYKQARDDRERIRKSYNFDGPFVTAYNDGERITVQEALMITQQKWYQ